MALTGQFRRFGGGFNLFVGCVMMVGLLALGLGIGNLAARSSALLPLIWVHALLPGLLSAWVISGMPGVPTQIRGYAR